MKFTTLRLQSAPSNQSLILTHFLMLMLTVTTLGAEELSNGSDPELPEKVYGFLERPIGDNWVISPILFPIYTPEIEFGVAMGGVATFSTDPKSKNLPRSTIDVFAVPTTNGTLALNAGLEGFWLDDQLRTGVDFDYDMGPENYWGVGYDAGRNVDQDEDVTEFDRDVLDLPVSLNWRIGQALFAGVNLDLIDMRVKKLSQTMLTDPHYQKYGDKITNVGTGLRLVYDTRDDTVNAYTGQYFNVEVNFYRKYFGSDQSFETYGADYRRYHQIGRPGRTIAWQVAGRQASGDVPWVRMSTVGSSKDLRGYTQGRFRDKASLLGMVEYRHMSENKLWKIGRQGYVVWLGMGFIGEDFGDFSGHELPNAGVGYRVEVQERRNLRVDAGWGYDELGVYLNFAEAF